MNVKVIYFVMYFREIFFVYILIFLKLWIRWKVFLSKLNRLYNLIK